MGRARWHESWLVSGKQCVCIAAPTTTESPFRGWVAAGWEPEGAPPPNKYLGSWICVAWGYKGEEADGRDALDKQAKGRGEGGSIIIMGGNSLTGHCLPLVSLQSCHP